jgi:uncharacterized protein
MNIDGVRSFAAPRETVWEVLNDPQRMAELMPGVESFEVQDDRHWKANVKIPLGLGGLRMAINFEKVEERRPEFARLSAKGTGVGALMNMDTSFELSEEAEGTSMRWAADVKIAGPVGSMGQRVLQPIVNQQVQSVLNALDRQVMEAAGAPGAAAASAGAPHGASGAGGGGQNPLGSMPPTPGAPGASPQPPSPGSGVADVSTETPPPADPQGPTQTNQD